MNDCHECVCDGWYQSTVIKDEKEFYAALWQYVESWYVSVVVQYYGTGNKNW